MTLYGIRIAGTDTLLGLAPPYDKGADGLFCNLTPIPSDEPITLFVTSDRKAVERLAAGDPGVVPVNGLGDVRIGNAIRMSGIHGDQAPVHWPLEMVAIGISMHDLT